LPTKTILFLPLPHYKSLRQNWEWDIQYWKEVAAEFIKQKHNSDMSRWEFPIEMYSGGPPHKYFFIALTLHEEIIIGPTKKLDIFYIVRDLAFLN